MLAGCLWALLVNPVAAQDSHAEPSPGQLTLSGANPGGFNPLRVTLTLRISEATFSTASDEAVVFVNNAQVAAASVRLTAATLVAELQLRDGRNEVMVLANDSEGQQIFWSQVLWAGSQTLHASIQNEQGRPEPGATVYARPGADSSVRATAPNTNGTVTLINVPASTVLLEAAANGNRYASVAVPGNAGSVTYTLRSFNPPSDVDNNDFSLGLAGWETGSAPVALVPHDEDPILAAAGAGLQGAAVGRQRRAEGKQDLLVGTSGQGPQTISRTFAAKGGTSVVTVRYKFITSEVPGGYFGTQFDDYHAVTLRSQKGGGLVNGGNSMNGLGLSAFTPDGATAWRELTLPVEGGDVVQLDATVTNVGDGQLDSQLLLSFIGEGTFSIETVDLKEPGYQQTSKSGALLTWPEEKLAHLSADTHDYYDGYTQVSGRVVLKGEPDDQIASLVLDVLSGGQVVASSELRPAAANALHQPFGDSGRIELGPELFRIQASAFGGLSREGNKDLTLRLRSTSAKGFQSVKEFGTVQQLTRYQPGNRYGGRDTGDCIGLQSAHPCGGDDWALPEVRTFLESFEGISWNDFSKMNGGSFPIHQTHRRGVDVDGRFEGYEARNAAAAQRMIAYLNRAQPGSILSVYVTLTSAFRDAIRNVRLADGRLANSVIVNKKDHEDHFHWLLSPNPRVGVPVTLRFENRLIYPIEVTVDNTKFMVNGSSQVEREHMAGGTLNASWELVRPIVGGGRPLGDPMAGIWPPIPTTTGRLMFQVTNRIGDQTFFVPFLTNRTATTMLMIANGGLAAENRCFCTIPGNSTNIAGGYYRLFSNSNIRLYRETSNFTGAYIFFGHDPQVRPDGSFTSSVESDTGILRLNITSAP